MKPRRLMPPLDQRTISLDHLADKAIILERQRPAGG
jgi:hypothetical protein